MLEDTNSLDGGHMISLFICDLMYFTFQLRNQAETELRALRAELTQKKINLTLSRNSGLTTYAPPATDMNFMSARTGLTPHS